MAEHHHSVIDAHLADLSARLAHRRDRADVLAELRDHLLSAADAHERAGMGRSEAERRAVADLGDTAVVARSFAGTRRRPALPTRVTQRCGTAALAVATSAPGALVAWQRMADADRLDTWGPAAQRWYQVATLATLVTTVALFVLALGLWRRHGGLSATGTAGVVLVGIGALISIAAWAVAVWGTLLLVGFALVARSAWRDGVVPAWALAALPAGWTVVLGTAVAADAYETGEGAARLAAHLGVVAGTAAFVAGAVALGRQLSAEAPVDDPAPAVA